MVTNFGDSDCRIRSSYSQVYFRIQICSTPCMYMQRFTLVNIAQHVAIEYGACVFFNIYINSIVFCFSPEDDKSDVISSEWTCTNLPLVLPKTSHQTDLFPEDDKSSFCWVYKGLPWV